jgi:hypothetical protein
MYVAVTVLIHYSERIIVEGDMKPLPTPHVPGKTEFERFDNAVRQVLSVSKDELLKRETREKKARERKKEKKRGDE